MWYNLLVNEGILFLKSINRRFKNLFNYVDIFIRKEVVLLSSDEKNVRHRFTVPVADTKVHEWIENQSNLGFSLRVLIKAFVRDYGYQDATCLELGTEVKKRGRPPKQAKIQLGQMGEYDEYDELVENEQDDTSEAEPETKKDEPEFVTMGNPRMTPKRPPAPEAKPLEAEDDLMNLFGVSNSEQKQTSEPVSNPSSNITSDDDGFVDPESLLR